VLHISGWVPPCGRDPSRAVQHTGGPVVARCRSQYLIVTRCYRSLKLAADCETVRAVRTPRHRHHPPGIRNFHSDSYAEIDTDSLRTGLSSVVRERPAHAQMTPCRVQHTRGVEFEPRALLESEPPSVQTAEVASSQRNSPSYCIICRINCSTIRPRHTRCSGQKRDLGDPSLALSDGCNGFRARSLKLASNRANRHTLKAALV
jgi:hypothetical protein